MEIILRQLKSGGQSEVVLKEFYYCMILMVDEGDDLYGDLDEGVGVMPSLKAPFQPLQAVRFSYIYIYMDLEVVQIVLHDGVGAPL